MVAPFAVARRDHQIVRRLATHDAALAQNVWDGITGRRVAEDSVGEALQLTVPERFVALVSRDDIAAAYAVGTAVDVLGLTSGRPQGEPFEVREQCRKAWEHFAKRAEGVRELEQGFGWDDSLAWTTMVDIEVRNNNLEEVKRIARLAGRMYAALRGGSPRPVHSTSGEVYSVEQGGDVGRLIPSEMALLASNGMLELATLGRVAQRQALQYAVRQPRKCSKGPLVLAIDESNSMSGQRNEWAKAGAMAVARVAAEDNRPVAVVHFSSSVRHQQLLPRKPESVMEMIRTFLNGGTSIGPALNSCADQVQTLSRKGDKGADVILVTDGVDSGNGQSEAIDRLGKLGARLWTIAIECTVSPISPLRARAAGYRELGDRDMTDGGSVRVLGAAV